MKNYKYLYYFVSLLLIGSYAWAEDVGLTHEEVLNVVSGVNEVNSSAKMVGDIKSPCMNCVNVDANKTYTIISKEFSIDDPYYSYDKKPFIVHLKRTASSPDKVTIKFKNAHKECGKLMMYSAPIGGSISVGCVFYKNVYDEQELDLNLNDLKKLDNNQDQIIELKFNKDDLERSKYRLEVDVLNDKDARVEMDNKYFGRGINLKFKGKN